MSLEKAKILVEHTGEMFQVQFNPEEITLNQDNNFANQTIPGLSGPILQFVSGNLRTLEMELLFDTYDAPDANKSDVRDLTGRFIKLMEIDPDLHAPPVLRFMWGEFHFCGVLARASQRYIMFSSDGKPVRARINATFNEYLDPEREAKRRKRQTADFSKVHVVRQGETLSAIAARLYQNPRVWRPIAIANGLNDPRDLQVGMKLTIPPLPFTDPETGEVMR